MNAMLVAAAIWMGSGTHAVTQSEEGWSSESDRYRHLGRAEAHLTATTSGGESQAPSPYWGSRGESTVENQDALMRSLGRAEAWYLGDLEGTVGNTDLSAGFGEMRRLCAAVEKNPRSC